MNGLSTTRRSTARRGWVAATVLATLSLVSAAIPAVAQEDPGYRRYRCTVLGDHGACPPTSPMPAERIEEQVVPGPYARYRMFVGEAPATAIEAARAIGEVPVRRTVRVTTHPMTGLERYERYLGRTETPAETRYEVLAEVPIEPAQPRAAALSGRPAAQ